MKKLILLFVLSLSVLAGDFINAQEAKDLVKKGAVLLDVRTLVEYKIKHLPGAERIDYGEVGEKDNLKKIEKLTKGKKDHPIVVYCQSGGRAEAAKQTLKKAGYSKVYNLGGWSRWDSK